MNYSVGSLADLISGLNTPNKPKVIKKAFKKVSETVSVEDDTDLKKNSKIKIEQDNSTASLVTLEKQFKNEIKNIENSNVSKKKKIKNRVNSKLTEESNNIEEGKKSRKRSLESVSNDAVEGISLPKILKTEKKEHNAQRRIKKKIKEEKKNRDPEELTRTIFVGNIPITSNKKSIKKHFKKYGKIETVRIRGIPVADLKTSKKVAAIKKEFNPNRSNLFCYVRFIGKESALKAEAENGLLFEEHHLRVHSCMSSEKPDEAKAIFVGNLSFNAVEDELWKLFETCGPISYVRIVRDSHTGMGKGFGYVNFVDSDAVQLALEMENVKLNDRELRISLCNLNSARKNKKNNKNKKITQPGKQKVNNKFRKQFNKQKKNGSQNDVKQINAEFQGTKFNDKKKHKVNRGLLEKKKLVKKIAPKPK